MIPDDYEPTHNASPAYPFDVMVDNVEQGAIYSIHKGTTPVVVVISYDHYTALLDELAQYQGQPR